MRFKTIVAVFFFIGFSGFFHIDGAFCSDRYMEKIGKYSQSSLNLENRYPLKYVALFENVKRNFSKTDFDQVMSRKAGIDIDKFHREKLIFVASPRSKKMQRQQHIDYVPKLVNNRTLKKGKSFFHEYQSYLKYAYEKTGVAPGDIISVLNWESRLGKYRGKYKIFKIFVGNYFYIDDLEKELYDDGAYKKKGTMDRKNALKRIEKIKRRSLNNLSQLLIQSRRKGFDPYAVLGSWAGAIGIPQFMPASMKFAGDGNDDGVIDLNTMPDAIMSVGNYLMVHDYHRKGKKHAFRRYNPEKMYVRGVMLYSKKIEKMGVRPLNSWVYRR